MRRAVGAVALAAIAAAYPAGYQPRSLAHDLLHHVGGFTPRELEALDRGEPLARVLRTERREVAVIGAVHIRADRERLLARYRDISNLKKSDLVLQVGTFSKSPSSADLETLTFEPYDLDAPKQCEPGDCPVRLSTEAIAQFRKQVNWTTADARQQSGRVWRDVLSNIARAYLTSGDRGLPEYVNKRDPLRVGDELGAVYDGFAEFARRAPEFFAYLRDYPRAPLDGTDEALYWSVNDLGIRPVLGITHQTIYAPRSGPAFVGMKRIYAAHYVDAGLGVTMVIDHPAGGFSMVMLDRIRTRSLASFTRAIVRSMVQDKSRDGVEKVLRSSKRSLEAGRKLPAAGRETH